MIFDWDEKDELQKFDEKNTTAIINTKRRWTTSSNILVNNARNLREREKTKSRISDEQSVTVFKAIAL